MSTINVTNIAGPSNTGTAALLASINGGPISGARNRIINGDMRIDQRNAGASTTPSAIGPAYLVDRFGFYNTQTSRLTYQQNAGSITPPSGFSNYLGVTVASPVTVGSSDIFLLFQAIEGLNVSDLAWGTASAQPVVLSFWVRSSLTGTFSGNFTNSATNRNYTYSYNISQANTWERKTIAVPGDTSGTWLTTNGIGIQVSFCLGAGSSFSTSAGSWGAVNFPNATGSVNLVSTNGATFYITGVQLEAGTVATPFERRSYGQELSLCQRYYETAGTYRTNDTASGAFGRLNIHYSTPKRAIPTLTITVVVGSAGALEYTSYTGFTYRNPGVTIGENCSINFAASAEL